MKVKTAKGSDGYSTDGSGGTAEIIREWEGSDEAEEYIKKVSAQKKAVKLKKRAHYGGDDVSSVSSSGSGGTVEIIREWEGDSEAELYEENKASRKEERHKEK